MLPPPASVHKGALAALDCGLTIFALALSFGWPRFGSKSFARLESLVGRFARRKTLAVVSVGFSAIMLRLAILPLYPIPLPFTPDDFSFLLSADTFIHGRLANPTPAMWSHFESVHISMHPTYGSMYFPGLGLVLAAGKILFGNPWFGILITSGLMCAAICWMLQAWLPPGWALMGGLLAMIRLGLFSYWINMFNGGGALLAFAGASVLGSLPRLKKTARLRYATLMGAGALILVLTRPWEGMLLCLPVALVLARWAFVGKNRPHPSKLLKLTAVPAAMIIAGVAWLGYYNYRAFGNPLTLPYTVNRATYATATYFVWQSPRPEPAYRHPEMRTFYEWEAEGSSQPHSPASFAFNIIRTAWRITLFFGAFALLPPLIMLPYLFRDRRIRALLVCVLFMMAAALIMNFVLPHYVAPFTAAFYAIGLQSMRHLRCWAPENRPVGAQVVRVAVTLCFIMAAARLFSAPLKLDVGGWPQMWYGPDHFGGERAQIEDYLKHLPGKQLAIVRYAQQREPQDLWVYNDADIDASQVVWAGEVNAASDRELLHYYHDRTAWLVQPDEIPARVSPYPLSSTVTAAAH